MQCTARCRWTSKAIKLLIINMKHDDSHIKLNHTSDRPIDQKDILIIVLKQIDFAPDSEI